MSSYMRVLSTLPSSLSRSSSSVSFMVDIVMMVEEIFTYPIVKEYVLPSPSSEIPLSAYPPYDPVTRTGFLLPGRPID